MSLTIYLLILGLLAAVSFGNAVGGQRQGSSGWAIILAIWFVYAGNIDNPDYAGYSAEYGLVQDGSFSFDDSSFEPGYQLLTSVSVRMGLDYQAFVVVSATIGLALIHRTVLRVPGAASFVYPLYLIYPLVYDIIQVRNFLAAAVLIYGVGALIHGHRWNRFIFAVCLVISSSLHFTTIFFGVLLFWRWIRERKLGAWPILAAIFGSFITLTVPDAVGGLQSTFERVVGDNRFGEYVEQRADFGFLVPVVFQVFGFILLSDSRRALLSSACATDDDECFANSIGWVTVALNLCILLFLVVPMYAYSSNFWRLARDVHLVYYVAFFIGQRSLAGQPGKRSLFNTAVVFYTLGLLFVYSDLTLIAEILQNNVFFGSVL